MNKPRILTGDRPTGPLHLGHYVGTLVNRVRLQDSHELFLVVADYHTLTTQPTREKVARTREHARAIVLDYLSVGIDPERATIYVQSDVPEVAELTLLFSMLVTVPRLERVPTLKEVMREQNITHPSMGLLSYPVLQAADILLVHADLVPVGGDQESHVEVTREIARRFNQLYGAVFKEPQALIGDVPMLVGIDGKLKMSKSLGNAIYLSDDAETVSAKVMQMYTDPARIHADVPGAVEGNPVFTFHDTFNEDHAEVENLKARYRSGKVGDVEVKQKLARALNRFLDPMRARRAGYGERPSLVDDILEAGASRTRPIARETLRKAREAMGIS
ncbi:MAG TPA: tryptophan--tRNA ligase [Anaerolineae bacterium]|nr:tryptophan--tRNA ligase [Anaerolineae bacterium]